jgi:hypothetical protein
MLGVALAFPPLPRWANVVPRLSGASSGNSPWNFFLAFRSTDRPVTGSPDFHAHQSALICENLRLIWLWLCDAVTPAEILYHQL